MISIENFYWILHNNLLALCNIDCKYYFPFGSTQNLSATEYNEYSSHSVLFYHDQEPIYDTDSLIFIDGTLGKHGLCKANTCLRIFATSEKSKNVNEVINRHQLLDWYFFFHGFAALDWFRDSQYVDLDIPIISPFVSLNHSVTGRRAYRMAMLARLCHEGLVNRGQISWHGNVQDIENELNDRYTRLDTLDQNLISKYLLNRTYPMILDQSQIDGSASAQFGFHEYCLWQSSLFHVVNETVFYEPKLHLTEKVFKPIVSLRPFLLVAAPGNLAYLRSYGFQTFDRWIDESYDRETDSAARMDMIVSELIKIAALTPNQLKDMHDDMRATLAHNKQHFFGDFRRIIVDELVENFQQCLRRWNNGRFQGQFDLLPDTAQIKARLAGA